MMSALSALLSHGPCCQHVVAVVLFVCIFLENHAFLSEQSSLLRRVHFPVIFAISGTATRDEWRHIVDTATLQWSTL